MLQNPIINLAKTKNFHPRLKTYKMHNNKILIIKDMDIFMAGVFL